MALPEQFNARSTDPLLDQAVRIFSQRQSRGMVIDPSVLGEPGWDILLYAYIAHHKGVVCEVDVVAGEVGLSRSLTRRWVDILSLRDLVIQKDALFAIREETEMTLSAMFKTQISEMLEMMRIFALEPRKGH